MNDIIVYEGKVIEPEDNGKRELRGEGLFISLWLDDGIDPSLKLRWCVPQSYWRKGSKLMGFHNVSGFCTEEWPEDLNKHGNLIIEHSHDADFRTPLSEGWHYFTFLLTRPAAWGMFKSTTRPLRFSQNVKSLKNALGRIDDQMKLQRLTEEAELAPILHQLRMAEVNQKLLQAKQQLDSIANPPAKLSKVQQILQQMRDKAMDRIALENGRRELVNELKQTQDFSTLSAKEAKEVLKYITKSHDPDEEDFRA